MKKHNRKKIRLPLVEYEQEGLYFVTTCVHNGECVFGNVMDGEMHLNGYGRCVEQQLLWLSKQYSYVNIDTYTIMPNHVHGIIGINRIDIWGVGTGRDLSLHTIKPLPELIGAFKTTSSKQIHKMGLLKFRWQRSFFDRIIRNEQELQDIREYIINNPMNWHLDRNNPEALETMKFWRI